MTTHSNTAMKLLPIIIGLTLLAGCSQSAPVPEPSKPEVVRKTECLQAVLDSYIQVKGSDDNMSHWQCPTNDPCSIQDMKVPNKFEGNGKCTKWDKERCYAKVGHRMREINCGCVLNCIAID